MASGSTAIAAAAPRKAVAAGAIGLCYSARAEALRTTTRVRRPILPHVGTNQTARCTNHPRTQGPHRHFVRQPVRIHDRAVVTPARLAIDKNSRASGCAQA
jgi:hypothetical protein